MLCTVSSMGSILLTVVAAAGLPAVPPGPYFHLKPAAHEGAASFDRGTPVVGTSYFYWYDVESGAHIFDADGSDALTTHPADMTGLSYKRVAWHERQLRDMMDAGIDFLMCVYWGVPGQYEDGPLSFSFKGIPPLVAAHDALLAEGAKPPAIGLFYDSSILQHNWFNEDGSSLHIDLTTDFGKEWFYTSIRDFFSLVPPAKWARVDNRPIVFLYAAGFAKKQDPAALDYVKRRFKEDFGVAPFIVKMRDWQGRADAVYQWGGAVSLTVDKDVAALGPGYDHSAVPGRKPLVVDRRGGATYRERWQRLLAMHPDRRPWMIHVETWSEWHEGTDIADSREYGRTFIDLTRTYAALWRKRAHIPFEGPFTKATSVRWQPDVSEGLSLRPSGGDGVWEIAEVGGRQAVVSRPNEESTSPYLYFDVADDFICDPDDLTVQVTVSYRDAGCRAFVVQYDNVDPDKGPLDGSFRDSATVPLGGTGAWKTAEVSLPQVRFIGRCNGADFRLAPQGGEDLAVSGVVVRKVSPGTGK